MPSSKRVIVFPHWDDNPYLNMLYLAARADGWQVNKLKIFEPLVAVLAESGRGDVVHIHWTQPLVQSAPTEEVAVLRLREFETATTAAIERGCKLVWTVHNKFPHECPYPQLELELIHFLLRSAHAVHVLSPETESAVADYYAIPPGKEVLVPHSSYWGVYDQSMSRADARAHWELEDTDRVILFFGQMRSYKGLDVLFQAVEELSRRDKSFVLMLAGKTAQEEIPILDAMIPSTARVIRNHTFVPNDEIQLWFAAADVAVFPYKNVLNSGSIHLAATFGLPTVLPRQDHLVSQFGAEPWIRFFDPSLDEGDGALSLARTIRELFPPSAELAGSARVFAMSYTPYDMAREFAIALEAIAEAP